VPGAAGNRRLYGDDKITIIIMIRLVEKASIILMIVGNGVNDENKSR